MEFKAVKCPGCGADIDYDPDREFMFCQYCGTKIVIEDDARVELKKIELEKHKFDTEQKNKEEEEHSDKLFNLIFPGFCLLIFGMVCLTYSTDEKVNMPIGILLTIGGIALIWIAIKTHINFKKNHH